MLVAMLLARCGRSAVAVRGAAAGLGGRGAVGSRRMVAASASAVAASAAAASAAAAAAQAWQQRQHVQLATRGRGCCCFMSTTSTPQDMRGHDEHNGDTTSTARDVQVHGGGEGGSPVRGAAPLPPEVEARVRDVLGGTSTRELAQVVQLAQDEEQLFSIVDVIVQNQPARGHVKFINAVLNRMDELNADVEVHFYNRLLEVFPVTNTYKTKSLLDAVWPRPSLQVDAALKVLNRMENEGVMPNGHTFHSLMEVFGRASQPIKKVRSMGYWMRYFMDSNPFSISMLPERPRNERAFMHYTAQRIGGEASTCHEMRVTVPGDCDDAEVGLWFTHSEEQAQQIIQFAKQGVRMRISGPFETWTAGLRKRYLRLDAVVTSSTRARIEYVLGTCVAYDAALTDRITNDPAFYSAPALWERCADAWVEHLASTCEQAGSHLFLRDIADTYMHGDSDDDDDDGADVGGSDGVEAEVDDEVTNAADARSEGTSSR